MIGLVYELMTFKVLLHEHRLINYLYYCNNLLHVLQQNDARKGIHNSQGTISKMVDLVDSMDTTTCPKW